MTPRHPPKWAVAYDKEARKFSTTKTAKLLALRGAALKGLGNESRGGKIKRAGES